MKFSMDECTCRLAPNGRRVIRHEPSEVEVEYAGNVPEETVIFALKRLVEREE
jgi:hypothetical protein